MKFNIHIYNKRSEYRWKRWGYMPFKINEAKDGGNIAFAFGIGVIRIDL